MDTSQIHAENVSAELGIQIGQAESPVTIIEYINVRCPYCRQWFEEENDFLSSQVAEGKVRRVIKLFDKEKPGLAKGNIMHQYIPTHSATACLAAIKAIYQDQDIWGELETFEEVATYAEETLHLEKQANQSMTEAIVAEADQAGVKFIPTMFINDTIFDQKISQVELKKLLASQENKN